jgi:ABC-2 type transport system ATP-binding protein
MSQALDSIVVKDLYKGFGDKKVLENLSLNLAPRVVFGLVGLNGVGKTTLIRTLLGLLHPDQGTCTVLGMNPSDHQPSYYHRIGVVLENNGFFGNLSVLENLSFFAAARGVSREEMNVYFEKHWKDTDIGRDTRSVKYFSRGQKMQCALCRAFLGWPEVYFFDEPVVALDLEAYNQFCEMVRIAHSKHATIIISSHQLDTIEELCTSVGVLENGSITFIGDQEEKKKPEQWIIKADYNDEYKSIIEKATKNTVTYEDGQWHFIISDSSEVVIPEIISNLVSEGCIIHFVKPEKMSFRETIKSFYVGDV